MKFKDFIAKIDPQPKPKRMEPVGWVKGAKFRWKNDKLVRTISQIQTYGQFINRPSAGGELVVIDSNLIPNFQRNCELV